MKTGSKRKTSTLNLRVSSEFKKRLSEEAEKTRRSVTNYLEVTLLDLWESRVETKPERKNTNTKNSAGV